VSPVFRHGGLRLYLLKLLDEAPRHGYEVIRLLQDRFLGVYAPSPGTIYPRLARLEEEGLVTHDEVDGKKVYRITDKGREEINARLDDLAELEEQITESVRDIAREVTEDVRDTVRNLREELTRATTQYRGQSAEPPHQDPRERARQAREEVKERARQAREEARKGPPPGPRPEWADATSSAAWQSWAGWRGRSGEPPWAGGSRKKAPRGHGWPGSPGLDAALLRDLERLAVDFANQLRRAAWNTESFGENTLGDLRSILEDTLTRIRDEVFGGHASSSAGPDATESDNPERDGGTDS
jgi:DNA-binding PadR family transcriptional regulator